MQLYQLLHHPGSYQKAPAYFDRLRAGALGCVTRRASGGRIEGQLFRKADLLHSNRNGLRIARKIPAGAGIWRLQGYNNCREDARRQLETDVNPEILPAEGERVNLAG